MNYSFLENTLTASQWEKIIPKRRAGIIIPLFSIHSKYSQHLGDFSDLIRISSWCKSCGYSIIQTLPLNDMGYGESPYSAVSAFALDPVYINLNKVGKNIYKEKSNLSAKVNYNIKNTKLKILRSCFDYSNELKNSKLQLFIKKNNIWLEDYSVYKTIKNKIDSRSWQDWDDKIKKRNKNALQEVIVEFKDEILFQKWVQWLAFNQLSLVKKRFAQNKILFMGDIPFLSALDSADVWAHQKHYKLSYETGAPPDMYFSKGQRWGMPPYNWQEITLNNFEVFKARFKYAENFYNMFRLDHFIGLFRIWRYNKNKKNSEGEYDPSDEDLWQEQGQFILKQIISASEMLPCAEDLGTVPPFSSKILKHFGIPGMEVLRWNRNKAGKLENPSSYRDVSISSLSTHDSSSFLYWYCKELSAISKNKVDAALKKIYKSDKDVKKLTELLFIPLDENYQWKKSITENFIAKNIPQKQTAAVILRLFKVSAADKIQSDKLFNINENDKETLVVNKALRGISCSSSIYDIQLITDVLCLSQSFCKSYSYARINTPGTVSGSNWNFRIPYSIEQLKRLKIKETIRSINVNSKRI